MRTQKVYETMMVSVGILALFALSNALATTTVAGWSASNESDPVTSGYPYFWTDNFSTVNDVLLGLTPTAVGDPTAGGNATRASVTDGTLQTISSGANFQAAGVNGATSLTYDLSSATQLSSIQYYGGWVDSGRGSLNVTMSYSTDSGSTWTQLIDPAAVSPLTVAAPRLAALITAASQPFTRTTVVMVRFPILWMSLTQLV